MGALILNVYKYRAKADVARARTGGRLRLGWGRLLERRGCRLLRLAEDVARYEGIEQIARKREEVILRHS